MIEFANDNDKTIEVGFGKEVMGIVISGIAKGCVFKKTKNILGKIEIIEMPFDSLSKETKEYIKNHVL